MASTKRFVMDALSFISIFIAAVIVLCNGIIVGTGAHLIAFRLKYFPFICAGLMATVGITGFARSCCEEMRPLVFSHVGFQATSITFTLATIIILNDDVNNALKVFLVAGELFHAVFFIVSLWNFN